MKVFISLSVLLNILLVGFLLGGVVGLSKQQGSPHGDINKHHYSVMMNKRLNNIVSVLPPEKSESFQQYLRQLNELKSKSKSEMRLARKQILQAFEQEPFDKTAYQQAVARLNSLHQQQMVLRVNIMAEVADYLTPTERKKLSYLIMPKKGRK